MTLSAAVKFCGASRRHLQCSYGIKAGCTPNVGAWPNSRGSRTNESAAPQSHTVHGLHPHGDDQLFLRHQWKRPCTGEQKASPVFLYGNGLLTAIPDI